MDSCKCPILDETFEDPVVGDDGHTYERKAITEWLNRNAISPMTGQPMNINSLKTNYTVKKMIEEINLTSQSQQSQCQFQLDIDIRKTRDRPIFNTFGKSIYEVTWISQDGGPPIVLLEIKGAKANREASFYTQLSCHPHIVRTFGLVQCNPSSTMLLQEYAPHRDLAELLQNNRFKPNEAVLLRIFEQICDAMICLADNDIVHGDLACRNILVFQYDTNDPEKNLVKLTDFGLTQGSKLYSVVNSSELSTMTTIPIRYAAPEILRDPNKLNYSQKSDIYSMGVLIWEACSYGQLPYAYLQNDNDIRQRKLNNERLPKPYLCSNQLWTIINECWHLDPQNRFDFKLLKQSLLKLEFQPIPKETPKKNTFFKKFLSFFKPKKQLGKEKTSKSSSKHQPTECNNSRDLSKKQNKYVCNCGRKCSNQTDLDRHLNYCSNSSNCNHHHANNYIDLEEIDTHIFQSRNSTVPCSSSTWDQRLIQENDEYIYNFDPRNLNRQIRQTSNKTDSHPLITKRRHSQDVVRIPCEFCNQSIDLSHWSTHTEHCRGQEAHRRQAYAEIINQEPVTEEIPCEYCKKLYSIERLQTHEIICQYNPANVSRPSRPISNYVLRSKDIVNRTNDPVYDDNITRFSTRRQQPPPDHEAREFSNLNTSPQGYQSSSMISSKTQQRNHRQIRRSILNPTLSRSVPEDIHNERRNQSQSSIDKSLQTSTNKNLVGHKYRLSASGNHIHGAQCNPAYSNFCNPIPWKN